MIIGLILTVALCDVGTVLAFAQIFVVETQLLVESVWPSLLSVNCCLVDAHFAVHSNLLNVFDLGGQRRCLRHRHVCAESIHPSALLYLANFRRLFRRRLRCHSCC
uniref:Uncharacterized protein n=1 Tax=Ixodes ricinus TaxID=34613 RepID=A0A6B0UHM7_IXORI